MRCQDTSCTSAGTISSPMTKSCVVPACSTSYLSYANEDWVFSSTLPDFHMLYPFFMTSLVVPANQILRICVKARDGERPLQEWRRACGRPHTTWIQQICRDTGVTATEALHAVGGGHTVLEDDRNGGRLLLNASRYVVRRRRWWLNIFCNQLTTDHSNFAVLHTT